MSKKEFEEKFCINELPDRTGRMMYLNNDIPIFEVWQWIEQQIKDARVDELERLQKGAEQLNTGGITFLAIANRIKELTGELK